MTQQHQVEKGVSIGLLEETNETTEEVMTETAYTDMEQE